MKELSIEEKAKAYDKAVNKFAYLLESTDLIKGDLKHDIEIIFPELKESEDERIRKEILDCFKAMKQQGCFPSKHKEQYDSWIAWLEKQGEHANFLSKIQVGDKVTRNEDGVLVNLSQLNRVAKKQGEQKPADRVEPKFKVGDSISKKHNSDINKFGIFAITSIADNKYWYNNSVICDFSDQDLWELVEQPKFKKGDWVFHNTAEFIYMIQTIGRDGYGVISRDGKKSVVSYSAEINYRLWTIQDAKDGDVLNSTRVQATIIFKGFAEDGKHINAYCALQSGIFIHQETLWDRNFEPASENWKNALFDAMKEAGYEWDAEKKELKKIEHKSIEWHREDEQNLNACLGYIPDEFLRRWLTDAIHVKYDNATWNEEDEVLLKLSVENLTELKDRYSEKYGRVGECIDWLESKLESFKPHNRWKPSKEQMEALSYYIKYNVDSDGVFGRQLIKLYQDLKKLREE